MFFVLYIILNYSFENDYNNNKIIKVIIYLFYINLRFLRKYFHYNRKYRDFLYLTQIE